MKAIAVAGKGGTGKTTVTSLIMRWLVNENLTPVLAVDADANDNLGPSLGVNDYQTISKVLAGFMADRSSMPQGMTKEGYMDLKLNAALEETKKFDLLVMGRKEGDGCYCYPNSMLRNFLEKLRDNYRFMVLDNEAGLEHLSRGTTNKVDMLLVVSDHAFKGLRTAKTVKGLIKELDLDVRNVRLVINRYRPEMEKELEPLVRDTGLEVIAAVPEDMEVLRVDAAQGSMMDLPDTSEAVKVMDGAMRQILDIIGVNKAAL